MDRVASRKFNDSLHLLFFISPCLKDFLYIYQMFISKLSIDILQRLQLELSGPVLVSWTSEPRQNLIDLLKSFFSLNILGFGNHN